MIGRDRAIASAPGCRREIKTGVRLSRPRIQNTLHAESREEQPHRRQIICGPNRRGCAEKNRAQEASPLRAVSARSDLHQPTHSGPAL